MEQKLIKSEIESRIFTIRGMQVIIDKDLAEFFQTSTKRLNEQVKRNALRFPDSFYFQLDQKEKQELVAICDRLKSLKHSTSYPFAFTEHGIAMVATLLRTEVATKMSIHIINSFILFRNNVNFGQLLYQKINSIENRVVEEAKRIDLIFSKLETQLQPKSGIFFNDQIFDAYVFSSELISKAKKSIILIDNYIDETTLIQLSKRNKKVQCIIYTEKITAQLKLDLEKHNAQYPPIEIRILKNAHDRFLILDEKELYHLGASLKDLGKRWFAFSRMDWLVKEILNHLR
jgi:hypothetical protein